MALIIAGERSGVGKTTITLAMLAYLRQQGIQVQSFKVGPDYIDPMFHRWVTGRPCYSLDPILTSEAYVQHSFMHHGADAEVLLVEGVMGLFDGASGTSDIASTAHIARLLNVPILLVLDCARMSRSVAAIAHGYRSFDPRLQIAGVVLNRVGSDRHLTLLKEALEPLHLPILGVLHRHDEIRIPDRHLGLIPTDELGHMRELCDRLAEVAKVGFDWGKLLLMLKAEGRGQRVEDRGQGAGFGVSGSAEVTERNQSNEDRGQEIEDYTPHPTPHTPHQPIHSSTHPPIHIAIAQDPAFNFYYPDNLEHLTQLGADLQGWSPLKDEALPSGVCGLYLGGGFPEVFAAELAESQRARQAVRAAIAAGMPVYGECGGLMYLSQGIVDFEGRRWPMVGVLPTEARMGDRLTLGYRQATALGDGPLLAAGSQVWGHEFHRSVLTVASDAPLFHRQRFDGQAVGNEGWRSPTLHASYLHLHWGDQPTLPARFLQHCQNFGRCWI